MDSTDPTGEAQLLDDVISKLAKRLPSKWEVRKQSGTEPNEYDVVLQSASSGYAAHFLVEVKQRFSVRDVERLLGGPWRRISKRINQPLLVVSEYLGPSVRELLMSEDISYIDATGNIRISVENPAIYVETQGADKDPHSTKIHASANGAKAGGVIRFLIDVMPPYSGTDIARSANVNEGYVSRILETFRDEGLIDRETNGQIARVDWQRLIRRRGNASDLFARKNASFYIARQGAPALLQLMREKRKDELGVVVTGSFAANRLAPVAAPMILALYAEKWNALAEEFQLLPASAGADVAILRPENDIVTSRARVDGGMSWASPSQVAIDCLAGNGRMPSEGEALIDWLRTNESQWRLPSFEAFGYSRIQ